MGNRVMERTNPGGRTVSRHLVPRAVRRRRKRALRAAARDAKTAVLAAQPKAAVRAKVTPKVARPKVAAPKVVKPEAAAPKIRKPKVATAKATAKGARRKAAKAQSKIAKADRPKGRIKAKASSRKVARTGFGKEALDMSKAVEPVAPPPAPVPEPQKPAEPRRDPLDYLQDGAVEWGIKRE